MTAGAGPVTPDGRYLVVRGRLWRRSNPSLQDERRADLVAELMSARRAVGAALRGKDSAALANARAAVDAPRLRSVSVARCGGATARPTSTAAWR